jgi:PAS domain S-box-containing protein
MAFFPLLYNISLLVSLSVIYSLLQDWLRLDSLKFKLLTGAVVGLIAIIGMFISVELSPGIFFDGRTIILSVAGAFGGPVVAGVAVFISGAYRIYAGGAGALMGVLVIVTSSLIGVQLYMLRKRYAWASKAPAFFGMGLVVHLFTLFFTMALPITMTKVILAQIALPILTIYPLATLLLSLLFKNHENKKALLDELSQSDTRFRQIFRNSNAVQMLLATDGSIYDVNQAAEQFYGWTRKEMCRMNISQINTLPPDVTKKNIQTVIKGKQTRFEFRHRLASGEIRDVEVHVGAVDLKNRQVIFSIIHDVTERVRSQEELFKERALLRTLIDNLPDTVYVKDTSLRKTLANKADLDIMGKKEEEVIGKTDYDFYPQEVADAFAADDKKVIEQGISIINREEKIIGADGKEHWLLTSKTPLFDRSGNITGLIGIGRNISERVQNLKDLEQAKENAEAANRAKSEFLANMSHEIRTPMNAILGFSEALSHRIENEEHQKMLNSVVSAGNLLLSLLNDILDLSKIEAGRMEIHPHPTNLPILLSEIKMLFGEKAKAKGLELLTDIPDDFPQWLLLDEIRIKQVLFNLVGNATKFTHKGHINVRIRFREINEGAGMLNIYVEDTGVGIEPEQQEVIFRPFYQQSGQSNRQFGGTGLGLTITNRLIEKMEGKIEVSSKPGEGSCFSLNIPTEKSIPDNISDSTKTTRQNTQFVFEPSRVLVVDDARPNLDLMEIHMNKTGLQVALAENGEQALNELKSQTFDLIILDILMPGMDGFQVAEKIKDNPDWKDIPIVAFTAFVHDQEKINRSNLFAAVLYKPVNKNDLFAMLGRFLRHTEETEQIREADPDENNMYPPREVSPDLQKKLPDLLHLLHNQYLPEWELIKDQWVIFKIEDFATRLHKTAGDYKFAYLLRYAENLRQKADRLDLEGLQELMKEFPEVIRNTETLTHSDPL